MVWCGVHHTCGMVWYGVVSAVQELNIKDRTIWCGMVWYGMVRYGMVSALQELEIKDKISRYKLDTAAPV